MRATAMLGRIDLPLVGIVALAAFLVGREALQAADWRVMTDELLYNKLALGVWDHVSPLPTVRDRGIDTYSQLFPVLSAPLFGLFDVPTGFKLAHLLNAVGMASTAIPAYLITRRLTPWRPAAWLVAALTVSVPWMSQSTVLMTEAIGYPAFVWACYGMLRTMEAPSLRADSWALAGLGLAFIARTQFVVLAMLLPLAVVIHEIGYRFERNRIRATAAAGARAAVASHPLLAVATAVGAIVAIGPGSGVLGNYQATVTTGDLFPPGMRLSLIDHINRVAVGAGALPLILSAAFAVAALAHPRGRSAHAFAVLLLLVVPGMLVVVTSFDLRFSEGGVTQERYLFYIAPLLFAGTAACLLLVERPLVPVGLAALGGAYLVHQTQILPSPLPIFADPATRFHTVLEGRSYDLAQALGRNDLAAETVVAFVVLVVSVLVIVAIRRGLGRQALAVLGSFLLLELVAETAYVLPRAVEDVNAYNAGALGNRSLDERDWVDDAIPAGAEASLIPSPVNAVAGGAFFNPTVDRTRWWDVEFWNKTIRRSYSFDGFGGYAPFPNDLVKLDYRTGDVAALPAETGYLVRSESDVRFEPAGRTLASSLELEVKRARRPYRADWATRRVGIDGWTAGHRPAQIRLFGEPREPSTKREVTLRVYGGNEIPARTRYTVSGGGESVTRGIRGHSTAQLTVCVPRDGHVDLTLGVDRATRLADGRLVGARLISVRTEHTGRRCSPRD